MSKYIRQHDLTPGQMVTLLRLGQAGRVSQNELGRLVALEPANIHKMVVLLSKRGFILREKDKTDARKTFISLSEDGLKIIKVVEPLRRKAIEDMLSVLTLPERRQLESLLKRICRQE
jgi:DNA-binding MarR family transcriptional regulator